MSWLAPLNNSTNKQINNSTIKQLNNSTIKQINDYENKSINFSAVAYCCRIVTPSLGSGWRVCAGECDQPRDQLRRETNFIHRVVDGHTA
jgi:hypothetical protein